MKKSWAMKWVKALESGRYKQATGKLQDDGGACCCLGVLCRITRTPSDVKGSASPLVFFGTEDDGSDTSLPKMTRDKVGMQTVSGSLNDGIEMSDGKGKACSLITANDRGMTFKEIAKIIRKRYREL